MLCGPWAPLPNLKGHPQQGPAGQPRTWRGGTWRVPRRCLDPGDAERQGARAWGEGTLGRPGRGGGSRGVRGQGCHGPRLLFDHSVQHLGIEGVGGRFRVLPLLGGVCGEPEGTEVCVMGGWLPLTPSPQVVSSLPLHRSCRIRPARRTPPAGSPPAWPPQGSPSLCAAFPGSAPARPLNCGSQAAGATPDLPMCPYCTARGLAHGGLRTGE